MRWSSTENSKRKSATRTASVVCFTSTRCYGNEKWYCRSTKGSAVSQNIHSTPWERQHTLCGHLWVHYSLRPVVRVWRRLLQLLILHENVLQIGNINFIAQQKNWYDYWTNFMLDSIDSLQNIIAWGSSYSVTAITAYLDYQKLVPIMRCVQ